MVQPGVLFERRGGEKEFFAFRIEVALPFRKERQLTRISRSETTLQCGYSVSGDTFVHLVER